VEITHILKLEHFPVLLPTTQKKCSTLDATIQKNFQNAVQYNIFCEPFSTFKGDSLPKLKTNFNTTVMPNAFQKFG
jgi:hypothetical protein